MSVTCFLLLLLCIPLHACKAHHLGTLDHKTTEKKTHFFLKNEGENGFDDSSEMKLGQKNDGDKGMKPEFVAHIEQPKESENVEKYEEPVVSVNLGLPRKKLREGNPKHTSDYDYPPDVHPPSHNEFPKYLKPLSM